MLRIKTLKALSFLFLTACFFNIQLRAQSPNCQLTDPLFGYIPDFDPCCGMEEPASVCYDLNLLDSLWEEPDTNNLYYLAFFDFPGGDTSTLIGFASFEELASIMEDICSQYGTVAQFQWDSLTETVCAVDPSSTGFQELVLRYCGPSGGPDFISCDTLIFYPVITPGCSIEIPTDLSSILNPDSSSWNDLTIFNGDGGNLSIEDVVNDYEGDTLGVLPGGNTIGAILDMAVASGALQYGAGCDTLNCIDLFVLAGELNQDSLAILLNENIDPDSLQIPLPPNTTVSEFLSDEVGESIQGILDEYGSFTSFLNSVLGLSIPDLPCDSSNFIQPPQTISKGEDFIRGPGDPATGADQDYFSQTIAGLGLEGPGAANPSPSALEFIKGVNAGVDLYNGTQSTSIPLYTLQANDISIPISINSSNNGLKINDLGSLVGQNWSLDVGGMITRVVKGLPDEFYGEYGGIGVGRKYTITPRLEIPANVGLSVSFPGMDEALDAFCTIDNEILNGFKCEPVDFGDLNGLPIKFVISWTPLRPTLVNFTIGIPIYNQFGITVYLDFGFNCGVSLNEEFGNIYYEEDGLGFLHLSDSDKMNEFGGLEAISSPLLNEFPASQQKEVLNKIHSNKLIEDAKFFNDQIASWDSWVQAIEELINGAYTYKTKKLDTEPDEFFFSAGNYSGKFSFNVDGEPILFPDDNIQLEYKKITSQGQEYFSWFSITTPDGMRYTFGDSLGLDYVDLTQDTNYYLPNFYTYPEIGTGRDKFGKAEIDVSQIKFQPFFGPKRILYYGDTYNRNYRIMEAPKFSSAWHIVKTESLLTQDTVGFNYEPKVLTYYADKSYSHIFPNFDTGSGFLETEPNDELNPFHEVFGHPTKWENGRAEFSYSVTQTKLKRWDLVDVTTQRDESVHFTYGFEKGEIVNDSVCSRIEVRRKNHLYKGWELIYTIPTITTSSADCDDTPSAEAGPSPITIENEVRYNLGDRYEMHWWDFNSYFFINFSIGSCFTLPIRLHNPINPEFYSKDFGYRTHMSEFGSLMEVKALNGIYNGQIEEEWYNAEKRRTFLQEIREIDRNDNTHNFLKVSYKTGEGTAVNLPKRFSYNQDLFGYYNFNDTTASPLPRVKYSSILSTQVDAGIDANVSLQFGFYNEAASDPSKFYKGQNESPNLDRTQLGAVGSLIFASGGKISYEYELNDLPTGGKGAGVRVSKITEDPFDMPSKVTEYSFENPTVINNPKRVFQHPRNYYYRMIPTPTTEMILEQKVVTTSGPQNQLFSSKSNHVGYGVVTESWSGVGSVKHFFTVPDNFENYFEFLANPENNVAIGGYKQKKTGLNPIFNTFEEQTVTSLPPSLEFPENLVYQNWLLGVEYKTEVFNRDSFLVQMDTSAFSAWFNRVDEDGLKYFRSEMYQNNYPGSFQDNFEFQMIQNFQPFGGTLLNELVDFIKGLILGTIQPHHFKQIERNYFVSDREIVTGNFRIKNSKSFNFFEDNTENSVHSDYAYQGTDTNYPKTVTNAYSDNIVTETINYYAKESGQSQPEELDLFDSDALSYLNSIKYEPTIASKTLLFDSLLESNITALTMFQGKVVPWSNWVARNGSIRLLGVFGSYNGDGKPQSYKLAKHGALVNSGASQFFGDITFVWNDQLQLESRSYENFSTTYDYNDHFELIGVQNPDNIVTEYDYDSRGRLAQTVANNGRQTTNYTYNIAQGENWVQSALSFDDGSFPDQVQTQTMDGFGKPLSVIRENDGALLSNNLYDNFFREVAKFNITSGLTTIEYDASPITRKTKTTDAVGNITETVSTGDYTFFALTKVRDPNGHISETYANSLGLIRKTVSGEGSTTKFNYDEFTRLIEIINPINETFTYVYNAIDKVIEKKTPGGGNQTIWWDKALRPAAIEDGNGNIQLFRYDVYNRITEIFSAPIGSNFDPASTILSEDTLSSFISDTLLVNYYKPNHTWADSTWERILTSSGLTGWKTTANLGLDDIGRPALISELFQTNPLGKIRTTPTYTDAGPIVAQTVSFVSGSESVTAYYDFEYDDILRPSKTLLDVGESGQETIARLEYNFKDLVKTKYLGAELQKIDYFYDAAGKLIAINSPGEMECFQGDSICTLQATIIVDLPDDTISLVGCTYQYLKGVEINGDYYEFSSLIDLADFDEFEKINEYLSEALHAYGLEGTVSHQDSSTAISYIIEITIFNTNAETVELVFDDCPENIAFAEVFCCDDDPPFGTGQVEPVLSQNPDLFYEKITFNGLDISEIEIGNDCSIGFMRNNFIYDANHRVDTMINTFFNPDPIVGSYSTDYQYDLAGNILKLNRNGLVQINNGVPEFARIDSLLYAYADERLFSVDDLLNSNSQAQPKGFTPGYSEYGYDGNGNVTGDGGKGLTIDYNLLNLPDSITDQTNTIWLDYIFGGQKLRKKVTGAGAETRIYLGGLEIVDGELEAFYHPEGRALLGDTIRFQYKLTDHLGNTVVFFEDKDLDTKIKTEEMTSDPDSLEVLQRNYYYPFGMEMEGLWNPETTPREDYLYNGKEWNEDLNLNWYDYGARWYDATISRWNAVDPLADQMSSWSPYSYAFNNPIRFIELNGLAPDDIVYFNKKGEEIHRIKSDTEFKTYVAKYDGTTTDAAIYFSQFGEQVHSKFFDEAPMPKIIQNRSESGAATTGAEYQEHDYVIAAQTAIFNREKNDGSLSLVTEGGINIPSSNFSGISDLDPTLIKAIAMQESSLGVGTNTTDIMQTNNKGDWSSIKNTYGLTEGVTPSVSKSLGAGIRILATKGFRNGITYDKKTGVSTFTFQGWSSAVEAYNGSGTKGYKENVLRMSNY